MFWVSCSYVRLLHKSDCARFHSKVIKPGMSKLVCWEWGAGRFPQGYGAFGYQGKTRRAHMISWMIAKGPIPTGMFVCHTCDNPPCVRPSHLFLGTPKQNLEDMVAKGRSLTGTRNPACKLTPRIVRVIRALYRTGLFSAPALGRMFGVGYPAIQFVINRTHWKHVR